MSDQERSVQGSAASWATGVGAITLFVEDLAAARAFYRNVFASPVIFEDDDSAVFKVGGTLLNLLRVESADELVEPAAVGGSDRGARAVYTIHVPDVDAVCSSLRERGVALLNGPVDRPWGIRTASFQDSAGHIWEIAT